MTPTTHRAAPARPFRSRPFRSGATGPRATRLRTARRCAGAAAGALLAVLALGAAPAHGAAAAAQPAGFDFSACPSADELPEGADPGTWRCEVMHATGHLRMGAVDEPLTEPMAIAFAEGRVGGAYHQVFGGMTAAPIRLGGTPLTLTPRYGGYSDFLSDDTRRGEFDIVFAIGSAHRPPALPPSGCSVGDEREAVHLVLKDTEPTRVISTDPLVVAFGARDAAFAAPATSGCGPLGRVLDRALGLPSAAGANTFDMDVTVAIRPYPQPGPGE